MSLIERISASPDVASARFDSGPEWEDVPPVPPVPSAPPVPPRRQVAGPLRIFIGYDRRQPLAFTVCAHSILRQATRRVTIEPLILDWMPMQRRGLTDFTYTRWLVPWLCDYQGDALFLDPDAIARGDLTEIPRLADPAMAATVVKGRLRFEWASLVYFQCSSGPCRALTPEYVADEKNQPASFAWCPEDRLGSLPAEWNHLVLYDEPNPAAKYIHYTAGIPCWPETARSESAPLWHEEAQHALETVSWDALMGKSVHRPAVEGLNRVAS